jgi:hypothetical protein
MLQLAIEYLSFVKVYLNVERVVDKDCIILLVVHL